MQPTIREALQRASSFLSESGINASPFIAEYLIRSYLKWDRTRFVMELSSKLPLQDWLGIETWLKRAAAGEPIQYIVGEQEFFGKSFFVDPSVLIPRPETEILVEQVLLESDSIWGSEGRVRMIDLGTGSGVIPVTIALQRPSWEIWALEYSSEALKVARRNAERHGVKERIHFIQGDMLKLHQALDPNLRFDVILSNPPYIPSADIACLETNVRDHEPHLALDGGPDGLMFYRGIINQLSGILHSPGLVAFEVGIGQAREVADLLRRIGVKETRILSDFQHIERVVLAYC